MKKTALFLLLVLGLSSTALGYCSVCVNVQNMECGTDILQVSGRLCCTGDWEVDDYCVKRIGNQVYVDVYLECTSLCGCTCEVVDEPVELDLPGDCPLKCGLYTLVVRVWCTYEGCACYPYNMFCQPIFCGMAMDSFQVVCDCCGCYPCRCAFCWPCCGNTVNDD